MTLPILVTGGTGRLGRRGVRRLVATGGGIWVLTRHGRQQPTASSSSPATCHRRGVDAAAVETAGGGPPAMNHGEAAAGAVGGPE